MSASTEKKLRQAAREAGTDKKTLALEKAAKEKARSKRRWTLGTIAVVVLIAAVLILSSPLMYKTTAYSVGGRRYNVGRTNFSYASQYRTYLSQNPYASMFLDTSNGSRGLDKQDCPLTEEGSWKDFFLDAARTDMIQTAALLDYSNANGITLTEDDIAAVDANVEDMIRYTAASIYASSTGMNPTDDQLSVLAASFGSAEEAARAVGFGSGDKLLAATYGSGVNKRVVRDALMDSTLASKALNAYGDTISYSDEQLEQTYQSYEGSRDYFDYAYVYVPAETVAPADGSAAAAPTDDTLAAAKKTAESIEAACREAEGEDVYANLQQAAEAAGLSATRSTAAAGSGLSFAADWLKDAARRSGDITVAEGTTGSYVVVFFGRNDNNYHRTSVRHILIKAEAAEDGTYSEEAKAAAKARAEELLAEFQAGSRTEESFATMANLYSEDPGSNTNGGLYENIVKGRMVPEFDAFCFDAHQPGDTGIVYGESASYAGYHVIYYVGHNDLTYAQEIARADLLNTDLSAWVDELTAPYTGKDGFGMFFVG